MKAIEIPPSIHSYIRRPVSTLVINFPRLKPLGSPGSLSSQHFSCSLRIKIAGLEPASVFSIILLLAKGDFL